MGTCRYATRPGGRLLHVNPQQPVSTLETNICYSFDATPRAHHASLGNLTDTLPGAAAAVSAHCDFVDPNGPLCRVTTSI
jgi:hypothetical protein